MDLQSLILKILNKEVAAAEYEQLKVWKAETEENLALYQEINKIVEEGPNLKDYREFNTEAGYQKFTSRIGNSLSNNWLKIAVAMLLIALGAYYIGLNSNKSDKVEPSTYVAENIGQEFILQDGSSIALNQETTIEETSDFEKIRKVNLTGEAFFDIARDVDKPFQITLSESEYVEVLGTSFNIKNTTDQLEITVASGKVAFHTLDRDIILSKGDAVKKIDGTYVKYKATNDNYLSWLNKKLVFNDIPVAKALEDICKHFNIDYSIQSPIEGSDCNLSTTFKTESLDQILAELSKVVSLDYIKNDHGIYTFNNINCE